MRLTEIKWLKSVGHTQLSKVRQLYLLFQITMIKLSILVLLIWKWETWNLSRLLNWMQNQQLFIKLMIIICFLVLKEERLSIGLSIMGSARTFTKLTQNLMQEFHQFLNYKLRVNYWEVNQLQHLKISNLLPLHPKEQKSLDYGS